MKLFTYYQRLFLSFNIKFYFYCLILNLILKLISILYYLYTELRSIAAFARE